MSPQYGRSDNCAKYIQLIQSVLGTYGQQVAPVHYIPVLETLYKKKLYSSIGYRHDFLPTPTGSAVSMYLASILRVHLYTTPSSMIHITV